MTPITTNPTFRIWFLSVTVITTMSALVYGSVQQVLRQSANDPQIQLAEDLATLGQLPDNTTSSQIISSRTLAPVVATYDSNGQLLRSTGWLQDKIFAPPPGVFAYTKIHGEDRFTWEPQAGIRLATVVTKMADNKGFVLAARSLKETEVREAQLATRVAITWLVSIVLVTLQLVLLKPRH